ncbi:TetR/AcrR family transcriptional regulator [Methylorubrum thiocyanatum]|uniref:TetR/AcrR family transcriptional regulator n=1 Tax=Methylorubrum thiocyanatum TaxID=47958 RepID=UPI003F80FC0A
MTAAGKQSASSSKRNDIVAAAKELLWERGYEATSPRDVLERSGAGQGSLYHHFPSKLDLARTALHEMAAEESLEMDRIFSEQERPLERIRRYLRRERNALMGCRLARLANESAVELPEFRQPISDFLAEITRRVAASLAEAQADGSLSKELNPTVIATTLVAVVEGGFILARTHWDPRRMQIAIDGAVHLLSHFSNDPKVFDQAV